MKLGKFLNFQLRLNYFYIINFTFECRKVVNELLCNYILVFYPLLHTFMFMVGAGKVIDVSCYPGDSLSLHIRALP